MSGWSTDRTSPRSLSDDRWVEQGATDAPASTPTAGSRRWPGRLRLPSRWLAARSRSASAGIGALAHPDPERVAGDPFGTNILVGYTNTQEFDGALTLAGQLACRSRARLRVVAATDAPRGLWFTPEGITERLALRESVASELRQALTALPADICITSVVVDLGLAHALHRAIGADSYDLIVLPAKLARDRPIWRALSSSATPVRVALASDASDMPVHCEDRARADF